MRARHCLAAALLLALAACGQATPPASSPDTSTTASETAPPPVNEPSQPSTDTAAPVPDTTAPAPDTTASSTDTTAPAPPDVTPSPPPPAPGSGPTAAPSLPSSNNEQFGSGAAHGATTEETPGGQLSGTVTTAPATILCEEVGRRTTQAECDDYKQLAQSAQQGQAAFNAPDPMQRGQKVTLQLAIGYTPHGAATEPKPADTVDSLPGETQAFTPQVGRFMAADLSGSGFNIRPLSNRSQEVMHGSVTTWEWEVTAIEGGSHTLTLRTVVEACTSPGNCVPLHSTTHDQSVSVKVDLLGQIQDLLQTIPTGMQLIAGLLAGLAALLSAIFGLRSALRKGRNDAQ